MKWIKTYESMSGPGYREITIEEIRNFRKNSVLKIFSEDELNMLHIFADEWEQSIKDLLGKEFLIFRNYEGFGVDNFNLLNSEDEIKSKTVSVIIETTGQIGLLNRPVLDIEKRDDDWFIVNYFDRSNPRKLDEYYICDEIDGVIKLLETKFLK